MNDASYKKLCIANILNGVTEGLSKYSGPTRVALIFAASPEDPVSIFDPQGLLRGHESKLEDIFFANGDQWRSRIKENILSQPQNFLIPENDLELSGLIAYGGSASDFFYQMWFTEHHPDMCSICPTERWLEQASSLLVHDYNTPNAPISLLEPQNIDLVCSLLRIDGAIHLASDARIHGFGCLLDGNTVTWENMARGARYNSALRFSAANRRIIVVVVSADRPVSIIYNGIEINAFRQWQPVYHYTPELLSLKQYLNGALL